MEKIIDTPTKSKRIELRVTRNDYEFLKKQADMVGMTVSEYIRKCIKNVTLLALSQEEKAELRTIRRDIALTGNLLKQRNTAYYNLLNKLSEVDKSIAKSMVIQVKQRQDDVLHKQLENFASLKNLLIEVLKKAEGE
ncbi:plasmid mobilization protein [uncultured Dialister sp.]|uniref:plasmid mobilization protein n=1 Tax=Dialister hominis TaxID=2582419 RepID=UPI0026DCD152|nr:hypothetical protein [uncultured Dialister sp.]